VAKLPFDAAVCLVLDRRYQKDWPRIRTLFEPRLACPVYSFVDGDGRVLPENQYDQLKMSPPASFKGKAGSYQQFMAMQAIVKFAKNEGLKSLLFIEDDCDLTPNFDEVTTDAFEQLGRCPWDLLYFGANHTQSVMTPVSANLMTVRGSLCNHCVGIRHTVFDAILALKPVAPSDYLIAHTIQPHYRTFAICPTVAIQKAGYSFIQNQHVDYRPLLMGR
jgi:hypothetical protein